MSGRGVQWIAIYQGVKICKKLEQWNVIVTKGSIILQAKQFKYNQLFCKLRN